MSSLLKKYSDTLTTRPDKLSWKHLKRIIKDDTCLRKFVDIANACINLGH